MRNTRIGKSYKWQHQRLRLCRPPSPGWSSTCLRRCKVQRVGIMVLPRRNLLKLSTGWLVPHPATCCCPSGRTSWGPPWRHLLPWRFWEFLIKFAMFEIGQKVEEAGEIQARRQWSNISNYLGNAGKKINAPRKNFIKKPLFFYVLFMLFELLSLG